MQKTLGNISLSFLDLLTVREGGDAAQAIQMGRTTAQHIEALGFKRYWVAEHHNVKGIASSATAVLVGYYASVTSRIRVGAGGVMLPNHAPLIVAEQFGTLECIYPGRIDLGLGRAPGTNAATAAALRRDRDGAVEEFPDAVRQLQQLLGPLQEGQKIVAVPGANTNVPIWSLGSSLFSAHLAAQLGIPYAFASHFAPRMLDRALALYRAEFKPSAALDAPYVAVGVPVIAAQTDDEAEFLASSSYQRVLEILRMESGLLRPPRKDYMAGLQAYERSAVEDFLRASVVGGPQKVRQGLQELEQRTQADEMIFVCDIFDLPLRLRSLDIVADICRAA